MQRILTNAEMREADLYTIEKLGVSEEDLVWRAGRAMADEINRRFMGGRVLVCIGKGNNGADGTVVAQGNNTNEQCNTSGWSNIVAISAGQHHSVGLKSDGTVVATGNNDFGACDVSSWTDIKQP